MASPRYNIERVIKAWIETSVAFTGIPVEHYDDSADLVTKKDRLFVRCDEPQPMVQPSRPANAVPVWKAECSIVMINGSRNPAALDAWEAALGALLSSSAPGGIVTLATSLFPNGMEVLPVDGGERQGEGGSVYRSDKKLTVIFRV